MGFDFAQKNVKGLLTTAGAALVADACGSQYPDEAKVVNAKLAEGESKSIVLFGWDACSCTAIAQTRFRAADFCSEQLTWSNGQSKVMKYLQCKEGRSQDYLFVYFRDGQSWKFSGNGFAFGAQAMSDAQLTGMATQANVAKNCVSEFSVNLYGEALSECRAAST